MSPVKLLKLMNTVMLNTLSGVYIKQNLKEAAISNLILC